MNKNNKSKHKTKEEEINEVLIDLENDLNNFKLSIDQRDKKSRRVYQAIELPKKEYQKVMHENNQLKRQVLGLRKAHENKKQIKRKYIIKQPDTESNSEQSGSEQSDKEKEYPEIKPPKKIKTEEIKKPIKKTKEKSKKQKLFEYINKK